MLIPFLYNLIKSIFGNSNSDNPNLTEKEKMILNKTLHVKNKADMLERIDYWIEQNNFEEAQKLSALYIRHNGSDQMISSRLSQITK